jgi:hypothetical protein
VCRALRFIEVRTATRRQINGSMCLISMHKVAMASVGEVVIPPVCPGFVAISRATSHRASLGAAFCRVFLTTHHDRVLPDEIKVFCELERHSAAQTEYDRGTASHTGVLKFPQLG